MTGLPSEFALGTALLAFTVAFFALVGREHKTPYITARAVSAVFWILFSLLLATYSHVAAELWPNTRADHLGAIASLLARGVLLCAFAYLTVSVFKVANRRTHFRDDILKNISAVRLAKTIYRSLREPPKYHYGAVKIGGALLSELMRSKYLESARLESAVMLSDNGSISAAFRARSFVEADDLMIDLAERFLANKGWVQYATCARHPSEFLHRLKNHWSTSHSSTPWDEIRRQVIAIDSYSPHFGFTDTVIRYA